MDDMSPTTIVLLDSHADAKEYGLVLAGKPVLGSGKLGFEPPVRFQALECRQGLKIGAYSFMRGAYVAGGPIIGRYCSIGANFSIGEPNHPLDWMSTASFQYRSSKFKFYEPMSDFVSLPEPDLAKGRGQASIGNDVWIGSNVMILHCVKVGDGAVIAAGAVVTSDVAPYTIVGGVPAKKIRNRFADPAVASELRRSKWWQFMAPDLANIPFDKPMEALKEVLRREKAGEIHRCRPIFRVLRASRNGLQLVIYTEREAERNSTGSLPFSQLASTPQGHS